MTFIRIILSDKAAVQVSKPRNTLHHIQQAAHRIAILFRQRPIALQQVPFFITELAHPGPRGSPERPEKQHETEYASRLCHDHLPSLDEPDRLKEPPQTFPKRRNSPKQSQNISKFAEGNYLDPRMHAGAWRALHSPLSRANPTRKSAGHGGSHAGIAPARSPCARPGHRRRAAASKDPATIRGPEG